MREDKTKSIIVNIVTALMIAGVLGVGYWVFFKKDSGVAQDITALSSDTAVEVVDIGSEVDRTVSDLEALKEAVATSKAIFTTSSFKDLQNFSVTVPSESIRRENPFIPTAWKIRMQALETAISKGGQSSAATQAAEASGAKTAEASVSAGTPSSGTGGGI